MLLPFLHALASSRLPKVIEDLSPHDRRAGTQAERHAAAALPHVAGSDYMVEHWLAAYATLLLS